MATRFVSEADGVALLSNAWTFEMDGALVASSVTAEVARRHGDGSWRYLIDNPYAARYETG